MGLFGIHPVEITNGVDFWINSRDSTKWVPQMKEVTRFIERIMLAGIGKNPRLEMRLLDEVGGKYEIKPVNCRVVGVIPRDIGGYVPASDGYKAYDMPHNDIQFNSGFEFTGSKFRITYSGVSIPQVTIDVFVNEVMEMG